MLSVDTTPSPFPSPTFKCFTVTGDYGTPQRKRGAVSYTYQMERPDAERLNGLPKSDKETRVPARSP